jgi:hypothetical protein
VPRRLGRAVALARRVHTFAWPPVTGATAYAIAFYRGDRLAFSIQTDQTSLELGDASGATGTRSWTLRPGSYRWYVSPLHADGTRAPKAVVRADVVLARA